MSDMVDHYRINVARLPRPSFSDNPSYQHFFATDVRDTREAVEVTRALRKAFPMPEYKIDVTRWEGRGRSVDIDSL